jgi:hypothetical protein
MVSYAAYASYPVVVLLVVSITYSHRILSEITAVKWEIFRLQHPVVPPENS